MTRRIIIVLLFLAVGVMAFAQNYQFQELLSQYERLTDDMERFAGKVARNPNGDHTTQFNNLQKRANNLQSQFNKWQNSIVTSPAFQMPPHSELQRLNAALDKIERASLRINNALW